MLNLSEQVIKAMNLSPNRHDLRNNTFGPKQSNMYFSDFKTAERHTYYEDQMMDMNPQSDVSLEKDSLSKDTEPQEVEKHETSKRETSSFMQDDDIRDYSDDEKAMLLILDNTAKVYQYQLSDEYMLKLLKHNGGGIYLSEYITLIKENDIRISKGIVDLGESSLQRFLINKEKSVYQFPANETDSLMVIRDGECSAKLRLNK